MPSFDWAETTAELTEEPRVASTQYGDGYRQTAPDGLNPVRQVWALTFKGMDSETGNAVRDFLRARVNATTGLEPFDWVPVWATTPLRVTCKTWRRSMADAYGFSDISATFEQEFAA